MLSVSKTKKRSSGKATKRINTETGGNVSTPSTSLKEKWREAKLVPAQDAAGITAFLDIHACRLDLTVLDKSPC